MEPFLAFYLALAISVAGSLICGIHDLFTTDIPDSVTNFMIVSGIAIWYFHSIFTGSMLPLAMSLATGLAFTAIGSLLYKSGNWGGGDGKLLAAMGFLLPFHPSIPAFPLKFFLNLFYVGGIYSLFYALVLALRVESVAEEFSERMKRTRGRAVATSAILSAASLYLLGPVQAVIVFLSVFSIFVAWNFGKAVEERAFIREIDARDVKEGDVLASSKKWIGLTKDEAERIRKSGGKVEIKEGVRFGPVFFLSLLFTLATGKFFGIV